MIRLPHTAVPDLTFDGSVILRSQMEASAMRRVLLATLLVLGFAGTANAEFDYTFVQLNYSQIDFDNGDGDAFGISGSYALTNEFHVFGGAEFSDLDFGVDASVWAAGFGYNTELTPDLDIVAQALLQSVQVDTPFGDGDDSGLGFNLGLRYGLSDLVELNAGINYVNLDDSGDTTAFSAAALFNVTARFTLGINALFDDDADAIGVLGRLYF